MTSLSGCAECGDAFEDSFVTCKSCDIVSTAGAGTVILQSVTILSLVWTASLLVIPLLVNRLFVLSVLSVTILSLFRIASVLANLLNVSRLFVLSVLSVTILSLFWFSLLLAHSPGCETIDCLTFSWDTVFPNLEMCNNC